MALRAIVAAGCVWGLYNAALVTIFGFGRAMLAERGWSLTAAGSTISLVLWLSSLSVPLGGILADRTGRHTAVMHGDIFHDPLRIGVGGPIAAGTVASMAGTSGVAFDVAPAMLAGCFVAFWMFKKVSERQVAVRLASPS